MTRKLVYLTTNPHKVEEAKRILRQEIWIHFRNN